MPKKRSIKIELNDKDAALVHYEKEWGRNNSIKKEASILFYANEGVEMLKELCEKTGADKNTVKRVLKEYETKGVEVIYNCARGKRVNHLEQISDELETFFDENPPRSIPEAVKMIQDHFDIKLTETPVRKWFKSKKYSWKKTKSIPAKADINAQRNFLDNTLVPLLEKAVNGEKKVYFADGVHLIYGYQEGRFWSKERIEVPSAYGRKRVNLLGFIDAVTYEMVYKTENDYLNAKTVCKCLKDLREKDPNKDICVILDNAAYQRCKNVKQTAEEQNIELIYLPPYSPNLNLIERLWKFLRQKVMAGKYYESYELFENAVKEFCEILHINYFDQLSSLLSFNFELLDTVL